VADTPRAEIFLEITPEDRLDVSQAYNDRERDRLIAEQRAVLGLGTEPAEGPIPERRGLVSPLESTSEVARARAEQLQSPVRSGVDTVLRTMTGIGLDDIDRAVRGETRLPDKLSLHIMSPVANVAETMLRHRAAETGLAPEIVEKGVGALRSPGGTWSQEAAKLVAQQLGLDEATTQKVAAVANVIGGALLTPQAMTVLSEPERLKRVQEALVSQRGALGKEPIAKGAEEFQKGAAAAEGAAQRLEGLAAERGAEAARFGYKPSSPKVAETAKLAEEAATGRAVKLGGMLKGEVLTEGANVNVARVQAEDAVKQTMLELNALHSQRLAKARETATHAETIAAAKGALTVEQALKMTGEEIALDKNKMTALRDLYNSAATHLADLKTRTLEGDAEAGDKLWGAFVVASELAVKDELAGKTTARALEARKILSEAARAEYGTRTLANLAEAIAGAEGISPTALAKRLQEASKAETKTMLQRAGAAITQGRGAFYEIWLSMLLSGPQTHAANLAGTAITTAWAPAERFLSANLDFGRDRSVFRGEAVAMVFGMVQGATDGLKLVARQLKEEAGALRGRAPQPMATFGAEKIEHQPALTARAMGLDPSSSLGGFIDWTGAVIRTPLRALMTEDAFGKAVNYSMELWAQAYRLAAKEGREGADFYKRVRDVVDKPPPEVRQAAEQFALVQTFNRELSDLGRIGEVGAGIQRAANALPMGRVILPFVQTPSNILVYSLERTPVLNLFADTFRADLAAGGEKRALALGKLGTSLMILASFSSMAYAGRISGPGPLDPTLRRQREEEEGIPRSSVRIGDTWYSINRLDPLGMTLELMGSFAEIAGQLPEGARLEFASAAAFAITKSLASKTYLQGVGDVLEAMQNGWDAEKVARSFARSLVPAGVRQIARTVDREKHETVALSEVQTLLNEIRAGVPGFSKDLPPDRNLWGDPILYPSGWGADLISPIATRAATEEPVAIEIRQQGVKLSLPPNAVGPALTSRAPRLPFVTDEDTKPVRLTADEYDRLRVLVGKGGQAPDIGRGRGGLEGMPPLKDALAEMMQTDEYKDASQGPDGTRARMIRDKVSMYKHLGIIQLQEESPSLKAAVIRRGAEKQIRGLPEGEQQRERQNLEGLIQSLTP